MSSSLRRRRRSKRTSATDGGGKIVTRRTSSPVSLRGPRALLREAPNIGSMYTVLDGLPVRRVLLRKTRTHVYYSVNGDAYREAFGTRAHAVDPEGLEASN